MVDTPVKIADVVVPSIFTPYVMQKTEEKSNIIRSGVMSVDEGINSMLRGGGLTFNVPSWKDLANDIDNVGSDDDGTEAEEKKIGTATEIAVRLNRNQVWSTMRLAGILAGSDPAEAIASNVADYWARRLQVAFVATCQGVFNDNAAAPSASEHVLNDLTADVSGSAFVDGVTNFTAEAFIDAAVTMGDSMDALGMMMCHSIVFARMQKNNMIDFVQDSDQKIKIPTFLGRRVIVDDGLPNPAGLSTHGANTSTGIYHTWLFGVGAFRMGNVAPPEATKTDTNEKAGNGQGQDQLFSRQQWAIHPVGHKYAGTAPSGGPSNANSSNNLSHAGSWARVYPERKQIKIARLITREA